MTGNIDAPTLTYQWFTFPTDPSHADGWAHHGVAMTSDGQVVTFAAGGDEVVIFDVDGNPVDHWPTGLTEGHGISVSHDADGDHIWIADPGSKMVADTPGHYQGFTPGDHGRVAEFDLTGRLVLEIGVPDHPAYTDGRFAPTSVIVDSVADGGTGNIWVGDGYGASLVHEYAPDGTYRQTLDHDFNCPHGVTIDRRRDEPELYIADRGNERLQVFGLDGRFQRICGEGLLRGPSAFAFADDKMIIAELRARVAVLDLDDQLVGYIGADDEAPARPGWPNAISADGLTVRPPLQPGRFNSPHGVAVTADGRIVVAEWLIGGRVNRLTRDTDYSAQ
ncbi:hypothetical protein GCM10011575_18670 [Microlunatus endophyticus]|uniref:NHL repeat-containing protein n=1 Tax=Microlunatus endophyticus TaxID=1716077 RepID=A0A917W3Z3_9ACTN|nr:hypothetical protein [Microlunatus endophyticus]GGL60403.1 hypothetical protein GCM10011575_18670 [Microlunatus endophyticus]